MSLSKQALNPQTMMRVVLWGLAAAIALYGIVRASGRDAATLPLWVSAFFVYGFLVAIPASRRAIGHARWWLPLASFLVFGGLAHALAHGLDAWLPNRGADEPGARAMLYIALLVLAVIYLFRRGAGSRIARLIGVEWHKLRYGTLLRMGLLIAVVATYIAGLTYTPYEGASGWATATHSLGAGHWVADIMALVLGATMLAGEVGGGTMKMILPHAYERGEWIAAKGFLVIAFSFVLVGLVALTAVLHAENVQGLGDVTKIVPAGFGEENDTVEIFQTADTMRSHFTDTIVSAGVSTAATGLIALFFSSLFGSVVPALSASFLTLIALRVGGTLLGFSTAIADNLYPRIPDELRRLTGQLGRGFSERWDEHLLGHGIALAVFVGALAWLTAARWFTERDLHG